MITVLFIVGYIIIGAIVGGIAKQFTELTMFEDSAWVFGLLFPITVCFSIVYFIFTGGTDLVDKLIKIIKKENING